MQKLGTLKACVSLMALGCALSASSTAKAALALTLSEPGYTPFTRTDTLNTGSVSFIGTFGDFQTNFVVGLTNQVTGTGATANMQLQSLNVKSLASAGTQNTLTVTLTDNGFTFPLAPGSTVQLGSSIGATLTMPVVNDSITFQSSVLSPSTTTGLQSYTAPASVAGLSTTSFSSVATPVNFTRGTDYALQSVTTISLTGGMETSNISASTTVTGSVAGVPEPTSAALALIAGGLVTIYRPRRSRIAYPSR